MHYCISYFEGNCDLIPWRKSTKLMPQNHQAQRLTELGFIHQHLRVIGRVLLPGTQWPAVVWGNKSPQVQRCRPWQLEASGAHECPWVVGNDMTAVSLHRNILLSPWVPEPWRAPGHILLTPMGPSSVRGKPHGPNRVI